MDLIYREPALRRVQWVTANSSRQPAQAESAAREREVDRFVLLA